MTRLVYRLENEHGHGPYGGDRVCMEYLVPHYEPVDLFRAMGLSEDVLEGLGNAGLVFGWRTKRLYRRFFKRGGQAACRRLGFGCHPFNPALRLDLPDGQVMFLKEPLDLGDPVHQALQTLLSLISTNQGKHGQER